jgi:hypothetical protein
MELPISFHGVRFKVCDDRATTEHRKDVGECVKVLGVLFLIMPVDIGHEVCAHDSRGPESVQGHLSLVKAQSAGKRISANGLPRAGRFPTEQRTKPLQRNFEVENAEEPSGQQRVNLSKNGLAIGQMEADEVRIRELIEHQTGEWVPPISALGGPPAHVLYNELVLHAGLKLYRDAEGHGILVFLDGETRRGFRCPSPELMGALDRFRMRRGLRPSPAKEIEDFERVVHARVTDPDANVPPPPPDVGEPVQIESAAPPSAPVAVKEKEPVDGPPLPGEPWIPSTLPGIAASLGGGFMRAGRKEFPLPHYIRILQGLVRSGGWMGTTQDLSIKLGEDEAKLAQTLIRYRADLAEFGIVVANVQVETGWRVLVVDRARLVDQS